MLRERLSDALKVAMKSKDRRATSILRLILAAVKDRDIAARGKGNQDGVSDDEVLGLLQSMIKQRRESIGLYEKGGRMELAQGEAEEIFVIEEFLPEQMSEKEIATVVTGVVDEQLIAIETEGIGPISIRVNVRGDRVGEAVALGIGGRRPAQLQGVRFDRLALPWRDDRHGRGSFG